MCFRKSKVNLKITCFVLISFFVNLILESLVHLWRRNFSWENASTTLACRQIYEAAFFINDCYGRDQLTRPVPLWTSGPGWYENSSWAIQGEQAISSIPPPGFCLQVPALTFLRGPWLRIWKPNECSSPRKAVVMVFITAIENKPGHI